MSAAAPALTREVRERVARLAWDEIERDLDEWGWARTPPLLCTGECRDLVDIYPAEDRFRSRVDMARHRFGVGEYKYFEYPLPPIVAALRDALYPRLAPLANRWETALRGPRRYPPDLAAFLRDCALRGQSKPTPLLLRYEPGGYNCLHQDLYGEIAFPLQVTCALSRRGDDYAGGENLVIEQRPRAQSRGDAIALEQGEALIFTTRHRPVRGTRGHYRATVRHGVSRITTGHRYTLGIIFHDAA